MLLVRSTNLKLWKKNVLSWSVFFFLEQKADGDASSYSFMGFTVNKHQPGRNELDRTAKDNFIDEAVTASVVCSLTEQGVSIKALNVK